MAENICLMLTEATTTNTLIRVMKMAVASVELHKRTALYLAGRWTELARTGELEKYEREINNLYKLSLMELFRVYQNAGGQVWVSSFNIQQMDLSKRPLIAGAIVVDEKALLTFLTQGTVTLNF
jgi:hypothetical protein